MDGRQGLRDPGSLGEIWPAVEHSSIQWLTKNFSAKNVLKTQKIARVRIHVERAIGEVKTCFRVFQNVIPLTLAGSGNQMWTVGCLLPNFCSLIIASKEGEYLFLRFSMVWWLCLRHVQY